MWREREVHAGGDSSRISGKIVLDERRCEQSDASLAIGSTVVAVLRCSRASSSLSVRR
jgi:hypothetical protein